MKADLHDFSSSSSEETTLARTSNLHKLSLYEDIVNFYSKTGRGQTFVKLMDELKGPGMRQFDLSLRLKRAEEGKEAASKYVPTSIFAFSTTMN